MEKPEPKKRGRPRKVPVEEAPPPPPSPPPPPKAAPKPRAAAPKPKAVREAAPKPKAVREAAPRGDEPNEDQLVDMLARHILKANPKNRQRESWDGLFRV